jgi:hypothetical protein
MDISLTTVLVALLGGVGGAIVAKLLEGRFQRSHDLRTWRLAATDDFTTGAHQALIGLRTARNALYEHGGARPDGHIEIRDPTTDKVRPEIREALDASESLVDAAVSRLGRIHILFGSESPTGKAATETIVKLRASFQALDEWPVPDTVASGRAFEAATASHNAFNAAVLQALEAEGTRWRDRWPLRRSASAETG